MVGSVAARLTNRLQVYVQAHTQRATMCAKNESPQSEIKSQ